MSIVSSNGMLVKRKSTSRLPIKNSESSSTISSAIKANESFTAYPLLVKEFKIGTRDFTNSWVRVLSADKIGQKGRKLSTKSF